MNYASGRAIDPNRPMVALTFDDGPAVYDDRILTALKKVGGRATFFVVGRRVASYPRQMQRMVAGGHEIGNHSWNHENFSNLSRAGIIDSVNKTNAALVSGDGKQCHCDGPLRCHRRPDHFRFDISATRRSCGAWTPWTGKRENAQSTINRC